MTQLINKGGFRERANRTRKYKQSENELTTLVPNQYRAGLKETDQHTQPEQKKDSPSKNRA
ncbi:hypothetical protein QTA56_03745 [Acinetobacter sp. VNH17]|uniref:Uncharacterized protein n=1 Tax=Acinetobacter thutiue TaxID=2998078 RepID=A0ABT7WL18_9GAMM|nr:hypothetical protein [Acinetobacter thutiue]MCY6411253.1 hypothetical protein [Acinetobacter thutiue]MDN0013355.1 hypothetical protein [Acinetobacter thutiue]